MNTQSDGTVICGNWDNPQVFFQFLLAYLKENTDHIKLDGTPCSASTVAAIHTLKGKTGGEKRLIMPYKPIIEAFQRFLSERGIHEQWNDAEFYRTVKAWDIAGFVQGGRKGNDPWRHNFYLENDLPDGVTGANVNCLGFSLDGLPDEIKGLLNSCQTAQSTDKQEGGNESD